MSKASRERWKEPQKPWHRQPEEPEDAWNAFVAYRDQVGARSIPRVGGQLQKLYDWANSFAWRERVREFDAHYQAIRDEERAALLQEDERNTTAERLRILASAKSLAGRELAKLDRMSQESGEMPGPFTLTSVVRLLDVAVKLDRLERGKSTEHIEADLDFAKLTPEERAQYQEILKKVSKEE